MGNGVLLLVDDSASPFWDSEWHATNGHWDAVVPVQGFGNAGDVIARIEIELRKAPRGAPTRDLYVVTDSMFGVVVNGGARMLAELRSTPLLGHILKRAVVYSDDPILPLNWVSGDILALKKQQQHRSEREMAFHFLTTGRRNDFQRLRDLRALFLPLEVSVNLLLEPGGEARVRRSVFRDMLCYGQAAARADREREVMEAWPLEMMGRPFSHRIADVFSEETAKQAEKAFAWGMRGKPGMPEARAAWETVMSILCPWASLKPRPGAHDISALRILWEGLQTGGDAGLLAGHPDTVLGVLSMRERAWVSIQLDTHVGPALRNLTSGGTLIALAKAAEAELVAVDTFLGKIAEGEQMLRSLDL